MGNSILWEVRRKQETKNQWPRGQKDTWEGVSSETPDEECILKGGGSGL